MERSGANSIIFSITCLNKINEDSFLFCVLDRVVPDTDLAGYPANNFAGYRVSGLIVNIIFFFNIFLKFLV